MAKTVITHPLTGTCFWCKISRLRQYRTATALKVNIVEMPVGRMHPGSAALLGLGWGEIDTGLCWRDLDRAYVWTEALLTHGGGQHAPILGRLGEARHC